MGHLPFMQLNHPLLAPPVTLAMAQQLGLRHEGLLTRDNHQMEHDRITESEDKHRVSPKPADLPYHPAYNPKPPKEHDNNTPLNLHVNGHAEDLRKSPNNKSDGSVLSDEAEDIDDDNPSDDDHSAVDSVDMDMLSHEEGGRETTAENPHLPANMNNGSLQGYSSIETLLMNIQGLLKVAGENARQQERQIVELKSEIMDEKKAREDLEKQVSEERRQKHILQKRLKKERRARRRVEDISDSNENRSQSIVKHDSQSHANLDSRKQSPTDEDRPDRYSTNPGSQEHEPICQPPAFPPV